MKVLTVEKPIKGNRTGIGKTFDAMMRDLPINSWCLKHKK